MTNSYRKDDAEEIKRLQTLLSYNILDTPQEEEFDNLVKLVSLICDSPIALISMIDNERQWYKAKTGIAQNEIPIAETLCQYTIQQDDILEIPDARLDERAKNNPLVAAEGGIRYYAGVNLKAGNGSNIGTVCVVDTTPKKLDDNQRQALRLIADQTMILLEARKKNKNLGEELEEILNKKVNETKRKLLQKETEYNLLLKAIKKSNGVIEFSPQGNILSVNDNYLNFLGYKRSEMLGEHHDLFLDKDQKLHNPECWSSPGREKPRSGRFMRRHKDGSSVWIQATYNPITNEQNEIIKIVKIAQDITKEREAEEVLKKSKDLAVALNIQKDNFIANMSHEIRTPIHAILGFTELLLEQEKEVIRKSYLESVKTAGDNLLYIINDILDLSKIEGGIIHLEKESFNLLEVVKNVFSILHLKAHQKKLQFQYQIHPEVKLDLLGDRNRLTQILLNLLGNALKFTSSGKVILFVELLDLEKDTARLQFKVEDTGIGIPEGKKDIIFDRFSQAEEDTSRKYGGTGLGLNISRQLIEKQGGKIWVDSKEGEGSAFTFYLPFGIGNRSNDKEIAAPVVGAGRRNTANILLCEDNELNQRLIKAILTENGYNIEMAENGEKGVQLLKNKNFDLIFMDIQMPIMNGYEATRIIRQELKCSTPIIALTANFLLSEKMKCQQMGMNGYLSKPFSKNEILDKIDHILEGRENLPEEKNENIIKEKSGLCLDNLNELTGGDEDFREEMILLLIQQAEKMFGEMQDYVKARDNEGISSTAHKLKTSFGVIGADLSLLNKLENISQNDTAPKEIQEFVNSLGQQLREIFIILEKFKNTPSK